MAPRANWKGHLKVAELDCPVALYTAVSASDRIAFHMVNRKTGNRLRREFVDAETGKPVDRDAQIKGYEVVDGQYVTFEPEELAKAVPEADKVLDMDTFIPCAKVDGAYFDKSYYLAPTGDDETFRLIRDGMQAKKVAALARTVLFRRLRTVLIRPHEDGLVATTLNFDYEVRASAEAFDGIPKLKIKGEMLDLARHIIDTKMSSFDPAVFEDRYENALADLVKAKIDGKKIRPKKAKPAKQVDLMQALRESAAAMKKAS